LIKNVKLFIMELKELTFSEQVEINGGSEASDAFWYYIGYVAHSTWKFLKEGNYLGSCTA